MADLVSFPGAENAALVIDVKEGELVLDVVDHRLVAPLPRTFDTIEQAIPAAYQYGLQYQLGFTVALAAMEHEIARRLGSRP